MTSIYGLLCKVIVRRTICRFGFHTREIQDWLVGVLQLHVLHILKALVHERDQLAVLSMLLKM